MKVAKTLMRMNGKNYLLDTNIIVDLFTGKEEIKQQVDLLEKPIVSAITMGELYFGQKNRPKGRSI